MKQFLTGVRERLPTLREWCRIQATTAKLACGHASPLTVDTVSPVTLVGGTVNDWPSSPLHFSACLNFSEVVSVLLKHRAVP